MFHFADLRKCTLKSMKHCKDLKGLLNFNSNLRDSVLDGMLMYVWSSTSWEWVDAPGWRTRVNMAQTMDKPKMNQDKTMDFAKMMCIYTKNVYRSVCVCVRVCDPVSRAHSPTPPHMAHPPPPTPHHTHRGWYIDIHIHIHIHRHRHIHIHTVYICTYTYCVRICTPMYIILYTYYLRIYNIYCILHASLYNFDIIYIHLGTITIRGGPPDAGPCMYVYIRYVYISYNTRIYIYIYKMCKDIKIY